MKVIVRTTVALAVCLAVLVPQSWAEGVEAVVNDEVVTVSEIRELIAPRQKQARATLTGSALDQRLEELRLEAINDLIDRALILRAFKSKGGTVDESMIDERINEMIRDSFGGDRQAFTDAITEQGFTAEKFRSYQRETVIVQEMRRAAMQGATDQADRQKRLQDWIAELRKTAFIKIYPPR